MPPVAPAPTPNPTFPEPISLLPLLTLPSLPVSPPPSTERPIITVGGGDTPGTDQSTIPSTPTRSAELVVSFDSNISGGSFAPPSVSPVGAFQVGMVIGRGGQDADRAPPGPEAQSLVQATQVVATTNDGDDNVRVVELLLARNNVPTTPRESSPPVGNAPPIPGDLPVAVPVAEEAAPDDTSPPLTSLVKWLAIPAAVALAATGWFWRRRGQKSSR